jgi:ElaB/YqjD/DUF883 family membrane-anchored ribosome-binding protein
MSTLPDLSSQAEALKAQASETARKVSGELNRQANVLRDATADVRYNTQEFIENNPWQAVAMAAAFGFLLGVALTRRR